MVDCGLCIVKESENVCACFGGDSEHSLQELGGLLSLQRIQAVLGQDASRAKPAVDSLPVRLR